MSDAGQQRQPIRAALRDTTHLEAQKVQDMRAQKLMLDRRMRFAKVSRNQIGFVQNQVQVRISPSRVCTFTHTHTLSLTCFQP